MKNRRSLLVLALLAAALVTGCSNSISNVSRSGGGTETVGITGYAIDSATQPTAAALVKLRRSDFLDTTLGSPKSRTYLADCFTNDSGAFTFSGIDTGVYIIEIIGSGCGAAMICSVTVDDSAIALPTVRLQPLTSLSGQVGFHAQLDSTRMMVYLRGMDHAAATDERGAFIFTGVPAGTYSLHFTATSFSSMYGAYDTTNVHVEPGEPFNMGTIGFPQKRLSIFPSDSIALRALLDSNGIALTPPYDMMVSIDERTRRITDLRLPALGLRRLTADIGQLRALKSLTVENNNLSALPEAIGMLLNLKILNVRKNRLTSLPAAIGQLDSLQELYAAQNLLTALPPAMGGLTRLSMLDISHNALTTLPAELGNCHALNVLTAFDNQLVSLPSQLAGMPKLQYLLLQSNQLASLPDQFYGWSPASLYLAIDSNRLCGLSIDKEDWVDRYCVDRNWRATQDCH